MPDWTSNTYELYRQTWPIARKYGYVDIIRMAYFVESLTHNDQKEILNSDERCWEDFVLANLGSFCEGKPITYWQPQNPEAFVKQQGKLKRDIRRTELFNHKKYKMTFDAWCDYRENVAKWLMITIALFVSSVVPLVIVIYTQNAQKYTYAAVITLVFWLTGCMIIGCITAFKYYRWWSEINKRWNDMRSNFKKAAKKHFPYNYKINAVYCTETHVLSDCRLCGLQEDEEPQSIEEVGIVKRSLS